MFCDACATSLKIDERTVGAAASSVKDEHKPTHRIAREHQHTNKKKTNMEMYVLYISRVKCTTLCIHKRTHTHGRDQKPMGVDHMNLHADGVRRTFARKLCALVRSCAPVAATGSATSAAVRPVAVTISALRLLNARGCARSTFGCMEIRMCVIACLQRQWISFGFGLIRPCAVC